MPSEEMIILFEPTAAKRLRWDDHHTSIQRTAVGLVLGVHVAPSVDVMILLFPTAQKISSVSDQHTPYHPSDGGVIGVQTVPFGDVIIVSDSLPFILVTQNKDNLGDQHIDPHCCTGIETSDQVIPSEEIMTLPDESLTAQKIPREGDHAMDVYCAEVDVLWTKVAEEEGKIKVHVMPSGEDAIVEDELPEFTA
jgi:hypothetical protein